MVAGVLQRRNRGYAHLHQPPTGRIFTDATRFVVACGPDLSRGSAGELIWWIIFVLRLTSVKISSANSRLFPLPLTRGETLIVRWYFETQNHAILVHRMPRNVSVSQTVVCETHTKDEGCREVLVAEERRGRPLPLPNQLSTGSEKACVGCSVRPGGVRPVHGQGGYRTATGVGCSCCRSRSQPSA
jgi:hypothetical protein